MRVVNGDLLFAMYGTNQKKPSGRDVGARGCVRSNGGGGSKGEKGRVMVRERKIKGKGEKARIN